MKCIKCERDRSEDEFYWRIPGRVRRRSCKECLLVYAKQNYSKNKTKVIARSRQYSLKRREEYNKIKENLACIKCGENSPECIDFHHLDPTQKDLDVGRLVDYSIERVKQEIAKCAVLCSNCHRKVHSGRITL